MTTPDYILNVIIGILSGIVASALTILIERYHHDVTINRRMKRFAGNYSVTPIMPPRDVGKEQIVIKHVEGCYFSITSTGGPTGFWSGNFYVSEDFFDLAHGIYRYPDTSDWGQHELLFDASRDSIFVYGVNRSKPGLMEPFSYELVRRPKEAQGT